MTPEQTNDLIDAATISKYLVDPTDHNRVTTSCPIKPDVMIGSNSCTECEFNLVTDREAQTVTCTMGEQPEPAESTDEQLPKPLVNCMLIDDIIHNTLSDSEDITPAKADTMIKLAKLQSYIIENNGGEL